MNSVRKNATLNIIKQICTIVFPLITFPYATRVLHTENYGMFTFASSVISYFTLIAALGVNNYAVREGARVRDNKTELGNFVKRVFTINVGSTLLAYLLLALLMVFWRKLDPYRDLLLILSTAIVFTTIGTDWVNVIFEDYAYITKRYIICQCVAIIVLFILVHDQEDVAWYAFVSVLGSVLANITNIFYIRKKYGIKLGFSLSGETFKHLFPILVLFANAVAVTVYIHSDTTILGILKDDYAVGIYGVASRIYIMVKQVANAAIYVVIPRVASLISQGKEEEIKELYRDTLGNVLLVLIPALVGLSCLSEQIVLLIAGQDYIEAAQPLIILSFSLIFASSACLYINGILIPFRMEKVVLFLTIISACINISLNFILIPVFSFNAAALTTLIAEVFMCVAGIIMTKKICLIPIKRELLWGIVSGGIVFFVCMIVKIITNNYLAIITLSLTFSAFLYSILMCTIKNNFIYELFVKIKRKIYNQLTEGD